MGWSMAGLAGLGRGLERADDSESPRRRRVRRTIASRRQLEREDGAPGPRLDAEAAVHPLRQLARDREAEARSPARRRRCRRARRSATARRAAMPRAVVAHGEPARQPLSRARRDDDARARRRVRDRVVDQDPHDLRDAHRVAAAPRPAGSAGAPPGASRAGRAPARTPS